MDGIFHGGLQLVSVNRRGTKARAQSECAKAERRTARPRFRPPPLRSSWVQGCRERRPSRLQLSSKVVPLRHVECRRAVGRSGTDGLAHHERKEERMQRPQARWRGGLTDIARWQNHLHGQGAWTCKRPAQKGAGGAAWGCFSSRGRKRLTATSCRATTESGPRKSFMPLTPSPTGRRGKARNRPRRVNSPADQRESRACDSADRKAGFARVETREDEAEIRKQTPVRRTSMKTSGPHKQTGVRIAEDGGGSRAPERLFSDWVRGGCTSRPRLRKKQGQPLPMARTTTHAEPRPTPRARPQESPPIRTVGPRRPEVPVHRSPQKASPPDLPIAAFPAQPDRLVQALAAIRKKEKQRRAGTDASQN